MNKSFIFVEWYAIKCLKISLDLVSQHVNL